MGLLEIFTDCFKQPTYFFENAGLSADNAYGLNVGSTAIAFCGTVLSWFVITFVGRRKIYVTGMFVLFLLQYVSHRLLSSR
jgi:MFS transporter, SP family, general alpha glucoside:H+ symporter